MTANNKYGIGSDRQSQAIAIVSPRKEFEKKAEISSAVIVKTETTKSETLNGRILIKEPKSNMAYDEVKKVMS